MTFGENAKVKGDGGKKIRDEGVEYGNAATDTMGSLKETGNGTYTGYVRNPPPPSRSDGKNR